LTLYAQNRSPNFGSQNWRDAVTCCLHRKNEG
jgi:hypothetical protein